MEYYYSNERNIQMMISLLKAHGIRKVVASPGATNICLVESMRYDGGFEMFSSADERSAAYLACGMAAESGEAVVITCTGATASRNYLPALTEAYYRKLPVIAITATLHEGRLGQNFPQAVDRRVQLNDIAEVSVQIPVAHNQEDEWANNIKINKALLEAVHKGSGPVHINLTTQALRDYNVKKLPEERVIHRIAHGNVFPAVPSGRTAVFVGAHKAFDERLTEAIEAFCEKNNGVVLCDQTSNYQGKYKVLGNLVTYQELYSSSLKTMDLLIHIGDVSGAYMSIEPKSVWRVNPDGEIRDTFKKLEYVFEMEEMNFFEHYTSGIYNDNNITEYYEKWKNEYNKIKNKIPELPFSNIWIALQSASVLPKDSVVHLGILNSLRSWNFFETLNAARFYSNTGGFGIDGCVSSLVGASLCDPKKIYFGIVGDLAFFYDMNVLGNRHISNNLRLMVVNNGKGTEFKNYNHNGAIFGDETDEFVAAARHYGNQSRELLKHYAEDLGFYYLAASNKDEFFANKDAFFNGNITEKPILFEVFTNSDDESNALRLINTIETTVSAKNLAKGLIGEKGIATVKNTTKRILGDKGMEAVKRLKGK